MTLPSALPPVTVLLSTYDGAQFLPEQLRSLREQETCDWTLLWRDDGSQDDSPAVMRRFAATLPPGRCVEQQDGGHLGIVGSFLALLRAVPDGQMVAFADQDDVWLPNKLARGVRALAEAPADVPTLYCARQFLVDSALAPLGVSPPLTPPFGFPAALAQNVATGCTVMLNPAAARLVSGSMPPPETLHDWWSYLVVAAAGGQVIVDPEPVVLYRQHGNNAVGAVRSVWRRGGQALRRGPDAFMFLFQRHLAALDAQRALLSPAAAAATGRLRQALRGGKLHRLRTLCAMRGMARQTRLETALFRFWFLLG